MKQFQGETIIVDKKKEVRCPTCGKLLCKGELAESTKVELWCSRCKQTVKVRVM